MKPLWSFRTRKKKDEKIKQTHDLHENGGSEMKEMQEDARIFPFPAMLDRMAYINRWSLMRNNMPENDKSHSFDCALISGLLCDIAEAQGVKVDAGLATRIALLHDATEIITGDLPTPIKYLNPELTAAYKAVEKDAAERLVQMLPTMNGMQDTYRDLFIGKEPQRERRIVKAADKLCAYIKCMTEGQSGNHEFDSAKDLIWESLQQIDLEEVRYFIIHFLPAYGMTLDQISNEQ